MTSLHRHWTNTLSVCKYNRNAWWVSVDGDLRRRTEDLKVEIMTKVISWGSKPPNVLEVNEID